MLKQELGLKQVQKLSPLQIQTIKLIELPVQELEQRIRKELEENPVLDDDAPESKDEDGEEQPRDVSLSEIKDDDSIPEYKLHVNNYGKDEKPQYNTLLRAYICSQVLGFISRGNQHSVLGEPPNPVSPLALLSEIL